MQSSSRLIVKPIVIKTGCMNIVFDQLRKSSKQLKESLENAIN
jgi:hypothetical protein